MGNVAPVADERTQKAIDMLNLKPQEVGLLFKNFRQHDRDKSGTIDVDEFYDMIGEPRSVFGDAIFELIDTESTTALEFGEFLQAITTFCLFESDEVLKFCFFVFDQDKSGFIDQDEFETLVKILHNKDELAGNLEKGIKQLDVNSDGKIDFAEFQTINRQFPLLLFPAFRLQANMMRCTWGEKWWTARKRWLYETRVKERQRSERERVMEERRLERLRQRKIRKKMGRVKYYLMPHKRKKWDEVYPKVTLERPKKKAKNGEFDFEAEEAKEIHRKLEEEIKKNASETAASKKYFAQKEAKKAAGGGGKGRPMSTAGDRRQRSDARRQKRKAKKGGH